MNLAEIVVFAIFASAFVAALRYCLRHGLCGGNDCSSCSGCGKGSCGGSCKSCPAAKCRHLAAKTARD